MKKIAVLLTACTIGSANAAPTLYPTKPDVLAKIVKDNRITSQVLMDTHDDNTFYVLPPKSGYAYASNISTASANLGFCQDMININAATTSLTERLKSIDAQQDA